MSTVHCLTITLSVRAEDSVYNLTSLGAVRGRGRSGLELLEENKAGPSHSPAVATILGALLGSLVFSPHC